MMPRWSGTLGYLYTHNKSLMPKDLYALPFRRISRVAAVEPPPVASASSATSEVNVNLNKMFRFKPCSLALPPESPMRIEEPTYEGVRHFLLKMMLFYSKQSKSIRQANVIYRRVVSQVDKPVIYDVFRLEKTFRTNFSMLVVHMWLCLRRLKAEGKEGVELGQYVYEIYNHDLETRVSKAGVNLLLSKWMRELEKVFYGNIVAFDTAMLPEAKQDDLQNAIWKNVFAEDGSSKLDASALPAVLAFTRYIRRECTCLSLTGVCARAPPCCWSPIPPPELRGESMKDLSTNGGFVSFEISARHIEGKKLDKTVWNLLNFYALVKYHVKCTKGFVQRRMRSRLESLVEALQNTGMEEDPNIVKVKGRRSMKKSIKFTSGKTLMRRWNLTKKIKRIRSRLRIHGFKRFQRRWLKLPSFSSVMSYQKLEKS